MPSRSTGFPQSPNLSSQSKPPHPTMRSSWTNPSHRSSDRQARLNGLESDCSSVKRSHRRCTSIRSEAAPVVWRFRGTPCRKSSVAASSAEHSVLGFLTFIRTALESNIHNSKSALRSNGPDASCSGRLSTMQQSAEVASAALLASTSIVSSSKSMRHKRNSRMVKLKLKLEAATADRAGPEKPAQTVALQGDSIHSSTSIVSPSKSMCHKRIRNSRMLKLKLKLEPATADRAGPEKPTQSVMLQVSPARDETKHAHSNCVELDVVKSDIENIEAQLNLLTTALQAPQCLTWYHRRIAKVQAARDRHTLAFNSNNKQEK